MPPATHAVLELHFVDVDEAIWCNACLLPSAVRVQWVGVNPTTLAIVVRGCSTFCTDCGADTLDEP